MNLGVPYPGEVKHGYLSLSDYGVLHFLRCYLRLLLCGVRTRNGRGGAWVLILRLLPWRSGVSH